VWRYQTDPALAQLSALASSLSRGIAARSARKVCQMTKVRYDLARNVRLGIRLQLLIALGGLLLLAFVPLAGVERPLAGAGDQRPRHGSE